MPTEHGGQTRARLSMVASLQEVTSRRRGWQVNKTLDRWMCPVVALPLRAQTFLVSGFQVGRRGWLFGCGRGSQDTQ